MKNGFPNWVIDKAVLDMFLTTKPFDPKPQAEHAIIEFLTRAVSPQFRIH